jgi:hypothetical protein
MGFKEENQFFETMYGANKWEIFSDKNFTSFPTHPRQDGLLYVNKRTQPSHDLCTHDMIQEAYGNITAEWMIRDFSARHKTGDLHVAVYDFPSDSLYLSGASPMDKEGNFEYAYDRAYLKLSMEKLFNQ